MKKRILFILFALFLFACNNGGGKEVNLEDSTPPKIDTPIVYKDTTHLKAATTDSLALTPGQLKDDSTFTDGDPYSSTSHYGEWWNAGINNPAAFKKFLRKLQVWVKNDERDSVASVISYPFDKGKIKNEETFKSKYDLYFTVKVKKALQQQNFNQIFLNYQGVMIGNGEIWLNEINKSFKITAINK